jgi:hypothetical protein
MVFISYIPSIVSFILGFAIGGYLAAFLSFILNIASHMQSDPYTLSLFIIPFTSTLACIWSYRLMLPKSENRRKYILIFHIVISMIFFSAFVISLIDGRNNLTYFSIISSLINFYYLKKAIDDLNKSPYTEVS